MEYDRQLPGHGDLGLLGADAFPQPVTPGFELAVESGDLSPHLLADLEQGSDGLPQKTLPAKQLLDPAGEDSAARLADDQTEVLRAKPRIWFSRSRLILTNCARAFRTARIS